jgi:Zn-dependent M28 family amino/carboxypeptidase
MTDPRTELIEALCSPACAGRRPGTAEGRAARGAVIEAMRAAGLDPFEQEVAGCGGANVLAKIPGDDPRWVVVGAHFDHLGKQGNEVYWGADDNAAAVGVLVDVGRALARERAGRGVIIAAFDGEEPPYFSTGAMGSQAFVQAPPVPLESIDFMVCMDLVGHRVGPSPLPDEVGKSLFALGAEQSPGTIGLVQSIKRAEPGLVVRAASADIIPPLSDYDAFWRAEIPFLFLTAGRSRVYHTPDDTLDKLDHDKIAATARWLERFVRLTRAREPITMDLAGSGDAPTLDEIREVVAELTAFSSEASFAEKHIERLRAACDRDGRLAPDRRVEVAALVAGLESRLA